MKKPVKKKEEQVQGRSDFIARISHELRTPLSAIMGFTEQLMQTTIDEEQEKYLKIIDKSAEHMVSLINDILLFSRSESNKIRFDDSPFSLMDVIKHSIADMEYKARKNKLEITYETDRNLDIIVMGDAFRLRQILNNLLSNAVKFTSEGWIKLICKLEYEEEDTYYIMFRVIDTGIGIRKDKLKDIFNPYRQADTKASVMKGGTGLGLSICKNLIDLQGGSLSVLSKPNKGSEFKFVIPYKKTSLRNIKTTEPGGLDTSILSGKRILLVDDDSVNRLLGETVLRKINCDVTISDSGNEAIDILNSKKFDLVLLDIQMPEPDGYAVADHIRNKKKDKETKIIAFTAATGEDEISKFHEAGIDDFVIKPYRERYLQNKMCKALGLQYKQEMSSGSEIILKKTSKPGLYDLSNIEAMAGNNEAIKSTAIKDFIKNSEESITLFENYITGKKWVEAGKTAHKLIPSYTHLQADTALSLLKQIELRSKNIHKEDIRSFENLISQAIKEIKKLVKVIKKDNY